MDYHLTFKKKHVTHIIHANIIELEKLLTPEHFW
jgi:hypothetical protein